MTQRILEQALKEHIDGDKNKAFILYQQAIRSGCEDPSAFANLGYLYKDYGDLDTALSLTLKASNMAPNHPIFLMNLGGIYKDLGEYSLALSATKKSLKINPNNPTALINYGSIARALGELNEALGATLHSLKINPVNAAALFSLGAIYQDLGRTEESIEALKSALAIDRKTPEVFTSLAEVLFEQGDLEESLRATEESIRIYRTTLKELRDNPLIRETQIEDIKAKHAYCLLIIANIHIRNQKLRTATILANKSKQMSPDNPEAYCTIGHIQQIQGKLENSVHSFNECLKINPSFIIAIYQLTRTLSSEKKAKKLLDTAIKLQGEPQKSSDLILLKFAISNCYHLLNDFENAAQFLRQANQLKLNKHPSDIDLRIQELVNGLSSSKVPRSTDCPSASTKYGENHIFIVGAPRSGSTLLESILSTNQKVRPLGESNAMKFAINEYRSQGTENKSHQNLESLYQKYLPSNSSAYLRTADKQLYNLKYTNLITKYLPLAKIIHSKRNPLDNILSMLRANLVKGNNFTSSAVDSARFLIAQESLMLQYKSKYPDRIYTCNYDLFVANPEAETRKLISWLGLEWSEKYISPESTRREVQTASLLEVRKPINTKSIGGWRKYYSLLEPTIQLLEDSNLFKDYNLTP